jgi:hypothetical protein
MRKKKLQDYWALKVREKYITREGKRHWNYLFPEDKKMKNPEWD